MQRSTRNTATYRSAAALPERFGFAEALATAAERGHHPDPEIRRSERMSAFRTEAILYSLRTCKLFRGLPEEELREFAALAVLKTIEKSAYLFRESEIPAGLYVVRRGIVNAHRVSNDGREQVIHLFRAGESLAEASVVSDVGYPADMRAVVKSEVMLIPKQQMLAKIQSSPDLALRVIAAMNRHLQELVASLESMKLKDGETRLLHWLLERCHDVAADTPVDIEIGMTKGILASELGTRHETLSRIFARLRDEGFISVRGRTITVLSPCRLQAMFEENVAGSADPDTMTDDD
ncbi:MAG: Crp/Fnr family transcriptional regulator [Chthoniobacterales bacterium]